MSIIVKSRDTETYYLLSKNQYKVIRMFLTVDNLLISGLQM